MTVGFAVTGSIGDNAEEPRKTLVIRTDSGVAFELKKQIHTEGYAVIGSIGRQSTTAEAIVGMAFVPGDNPLWYARGYAQIVQRELNTHHGLHSAFGIATPAPIIEEIRA